MKKFTIAALALVMLTACGPKVTTGHAETKIDNHGAEEIVKVDVTLEDGKVTGVQTYSGAIYRCKAVVLCTGTYLKARCIYGEISNATGPNGLQAANYLTDSLKSLGIEMVVMDDGWFGARDDDLRALGDWFVNEKKLGGKLIETETFMIPESDISRTFVVIKKTRKYY